MSDQLEQIENRCIRIETKLTKFLNGRRSCASPEPQTWNEHQRTVLKTYCGGEFQDLRSMGEVRDCGDGLLVFLMIELSTEEGCDDTDDAFNRVAWAVDQLREVMVALDSITEEDLT